MKKAIIRIWHGRTKIEHSEEYLVFLKEIAVKDYKSIPGNLSVEIWRRKEPVLQGGEDICHFWTVTKWNSYESIKKFAGEDFEKAKYYPEDKKYLLEFEEKVTHNETFIF